MFILIFEQLVKMFFIMVLAFICYRIGLVDQNGNKNVSNLLLMVVNPILIITVYQTSYDPELVRGLLFAFAAAAVTHVLGILISGVLIPLRRRGGHVHRTVQRHVFQLRIHRHPADRQRPRRYGGSSISPPIWSFSICSHGPTA